MAAKLHLLGQGIGQGNQRRIKHAVQPHAIAAVAAFDVDFLLGAPQKVVQRQFIQSRHIGKIQCVQIRFAQGADFIAVVLHKSEQQITFQAHGEHMFAPILCLTRFAQGLV